MAAKYISQREARRLQKRVQELLQAEQSRLRTWTGSYPGGVNIESLTISDVSYAKLDIAKRLGYALVVTVDSSNSIRIHAVRQ